MTDKTNKNSLFGGVRIGKIELCVKAKRSARYGGSGLLNRSAVHENAGVGESLLCNDSTCVGG